MRIASSEDEWRRGWRSIETREAAAAHTADRLRSMMTQDADAATRSMLDTLAKVNSCGLVTMASQPGGVDGRWRQRASVLGWGPPALVEQVVSACTDQEGLWAAAHPFPGRVHNAPPQCWPGEGERWSWVGEKKGRLSGKWLARDMAGIRPVSDHYPWRLTDSLRETMRESLAFVVVDEVWGREQALWSALSEAVKTT